MLTGLVTIAYITKCLTFSINPFKGILFICVLALNHVKQLKVYCDRQNVLMLRFLLFKCFGIKSLFLWQCINFEDLISSVMTYVVEEPFIRAIQTNYLGILITALIICKYWNVSLIKFLKFDFYEWNAFSSCWQTLSRSSVFHVCHSIKYTTTVSKW